MQQRVLVVHTGGVGDFLLTFPALQQLAAPVELAGQGERMALAVAWGLAERARSLEALDFSSVFSSPSSRLRTALTAYTEVLVWIRDDDCRIATALHEAGAERVRCYPGLPPQDWPEHATNYFLTCMKDFTAAPSMQADIETRLNLHLPAPALAREVVLHPGSGGTGKNWPLQRFILLGEALRAAGYAVSWLRGPAEADFSLPPTAQVLPQMSLVELAGHLAHARLYIGNDSGISHLAAMTGCPTLAIFGPTDPRVWAPRGRQVHVLHRLEEDEWAWPDPEEVLQAATALLGLLPRSTA